MYTIDLLKGQGRPNPKKRGTVLMIAVAAVIPVAMLIFMVGQYVSVSVAIPAKRSSLQKAKAKYNSDAEIDIAISSSRAYVDEISKALGKTVQWTPVFIDIVKYMPDSVLMDSMRNRRVSFVEEKPNPADPDSVITVKKIKNIISISFYSQGGMSADSDMQKYVRTLSDIGLKAVITDQGTAYVKDKRVKIYQIECVIEKG